MTPAVHSALSWRSLYDLTFHTGRLPEVRDGSFGFQWLLLLPLCPLVFRRRASLCIGLAGAAVLLATRANLRYLYAAFLLLSIPAGRLVLEHGWLKTGACDGSVSAFSFLPSMLTG